ncbi:MAG: porin [Bacteroidia bacterium]
MKNQKLIFLFLIAPLISFAQIDTSALTVSGYVDFYFSYDFNSFKPSNDPGFLYSYNRRNQVGMNLALLKMNYRKGAAQVNVALQVGSFVNVNDYLSQPIQELNLEVDLNKQKTLSLKTGIFTSHLGFESAIGADNVCLSQSLVSENSPYFLFGSMVNFNPNNKIKIGLVVSNGWYVFPRKFENNAIAIGSYISYKPTKSFKIYWATYNDINRRFYNNFYTQLNTNKLKLTLGIDYGQDVWGPNRTDFWYVPTSILQVKINEKIKIGLRGEYFFDERNRIISTPLPYPSETAIFGFSTNIDFRIADNVLFRLESRNFNSNYEYFRKDQGLVRNNNITASISARF